MEDMTNSTKPIIIFDMLLSYLKKEELLNIPPNSSSDLVNISTIQFHDPYNVEPDLSAGVRLIVIVKRWNIEKIRLDILQKAKHTLLWAYFFH